jgi:hypothetical protein
MASNPWFILGHAAEKQADGTIDLIGDSYRMVLVGTGYVPNQSTDAAWSAISANEIAGTGYTANGKAVALSVSRTGLVITYDCPDQSWASSTLTNVAYAVIVRNALADGTLAATDIPVFVCELEDAGSLSTSNGTLAVTIDAAGVYTRTLTAAV